jgi:APA family basic amino acid/polyamine antiporter
MATGTTGQNAETTSEGLHRALSRWNALAIVLGAVIGTGIYIRPASIAQLVQTPGAIMAVWTTAGLITLAGALTYSELASRLPRSGGEYAYLRETLGDFPAFLFGWMRLTLGVATVAALAVAFTVFLSDFITFGAVGRRVTPVALIASLATLNVLGVAKAGRFQTIVTTIKVASIIALIVVILNARNTASSAAVTDVSMNSMSPALSAYATALLAALGCYNGWAHVTMIGGEIKNAQRNVPWALLVGIAVAIAIYLLLNWSYLRALPLNDVLTANSSAYSDAPSIASRAATAAIGAKATTLLSVAFMISALGSLHCNLLAVPRVFFAMARDGNLPRGVASLLPKARTPYVAILAMAVLAALFAVFGTYDRLANMSSFGYLLFYALTTFGFLLARKRLPRPTVHRIIPTWVAAAFLVATTVILLFVVSSGSTEILVALIVLALGAPCYLALRWKIILGARGIG